MHRTKLGTFQSWEMQEDAPASISFETANNGELQVTEIHSICLVHVKRQGDTFSLPEPVAESVAEAVVAVPAIPIDVVLKKGDQHRGVVHKVMVAFCFIKVEGVGKLLFAHNSSLPDVDVKPKIGQTYDFKVGENDKGLVAINMELVVVDVPPSVEVAVVEQTAPIAADVSTPIDVTESPKGKKTRVRVRVGNEGQPQSAEPAPPAASGATTLDSLAGLSCLLSEQQLQPLAAE